ncbi:MAG: c-type cytochrome [Steroidobacteraceae bacterium]
MSGHIRGLPAAGVALALGMFAALAVAQDYSEEHADGRAVYAKWCAPCHDPGITHPGTHALTVKYQGVKPGVLLEWKDLPAATVKRWVRHGISVMPQFRKTEISDAELDALAKYLARNTPAG